MTQEAVRVEKSTREKTVSILAHDDLAAVQVSGQDQVIAAIAARLPDFRVMGAQDLDICSKGACSVRSGDCDNALTMRHSDGPVVDPFPSALLDGAAYAAKPDALVMVAADREDRRKLAKPPDKLAQLTEGGGTVYEVSAEQHDIRPGAGGGVDDVPAQQFGAAASEVDVADIQQAAGVVAPRKSLLADEQRSGQPDLERRVRPRPSRIQGSMTGVHRELCLEKYTRAELPLNTFPKSKDL